MGTRIYILIAVLALSGCGRTAKIKADFERMEAYCLAKGGTLTTTATAGPWSTSASLSCEHPPGVGFDFL